MIPVTAVPQEAEGYMVVRAGEEYPGTHGDLSNSTDKRQ